MGQQEAFCSICGGPFGAPSSLRDNWTDDTLLLAAGRQNDAGILRPCAYELEDEYPDMHVMRLLVGFVDDYTFRGSPFGDFEEFYALFPHDDGYYEPENPFYIPVHRQCMDIVDDVVAVRSYLQDAPPSSIVDDWSLWKVLTSRILESNYDILYKLPGGCVPEPHDFMGGVLSRSLYWEPYDGPPDHKIFEANPCDPLAILLFGHGTEDIYVPDVPRHVLLSLRNRRRIWELVEGARIGDMKRS